MKEAHHEVRPTEGVGHGKRGNEHRRHRREHDKTRRRRFLRPYGVVGQPGVAYPRPPERREQRQASGQAGPGGMIGEEPGHLCYGEDEDKIEEQLERGNPPLLEVPIAYLFRF